jgi:hypothetical protein
MLWYRSWPSEGDMTTSCHLPHIVDNLSRMIMSGQNYKTIAEYNSLQTANGWPDDTPGFCMLEWDIALDPISRQQFASIAWNEPREILVAPYRFHDTWCMWQGNDGRGPTPDGRPIQYGELRCDSFGLGCIYIPRIVLLEFLGQMDKFGFTDGTFGKWYHSKYGQARVTWEIHPQHIHEYESE